MTSFYSEKVVSRARLGEVVQELKRQGKCIVSTNGSFDLLHLGHVTMLQEAKALGDILIVGVNSDACIKQYKGKYRPICPQCQRVGMLAALQCTDLITVFDELTPNDLLEIIRPNIHVNSPEHGKNCVERPVVERYGGRIHIAQLVEGLSTTHLIQNIMEAASHQPQRAIFLNASDLLITRGRAEEGEQFSEAIQASIKQLIATGFHLFFAGEASQRRHLQAIMTFTRDINFLADTEISRDMLEDAVNAYDVILAKSVVISSKSADIALGRELNCRTMLLDAPSTEQAATNAPVSPHEHVRCFDESVEILLSSSFNS